MIGSLIALVGVGMVVFSGSVILQINPLGDFLSIVASMMWAFYCLVLKPLGLRYPTAFITRKVFLYGILSLLVCFFFNPLQVKMDILFQPVVALNLLFLGVVASMICFIAWNAAVKVLGPSHTANYIYVQPFSTLVLSSIILSEVDMADEQVFELEQIVADNEYDPLDDDAFYVAFAVFQKGFRRN